MNDFLRHFDRLSFWLGFLTASLFWFLVSRARPMIERLIDSIRAQSKTNRQERTQTDEIRLSNDTLLYAQGWHIASPLFSLDEILVPPRLLAPVVPPMAYEPPPSEDITDWAIPEMPDWPELASFYGAPWLTLLEALQGGANLAIIGQPGSGKTVALASLACQIIRKDPQAGGLENYTPVLLHAADLPLPPPDPKEPLSSLVVALSTYVTSIPAKRFPTSLHNLFEHEHAFLLIDGLDELTPEALALVVAYLQELFLRYPSLRAVVAAGPDNLGGLADLGFIPLSLTTWGNVQRALFISRWSDLWNRYIAGSQAKTPGTDPLLVIGWLLNNTEFLTPLELALKVWAAFAGDSLGPAPLAALEAYLRRMLANQPEKNRKAIEQLAAEMVLGMQPTPERKIAEAWLGGEVAPAEPVERSAEKEDEKGSTRVRASSVLHQLLDSGILVPLQGERVRFAHPALSGYLAAQAIAVRCAGDKLVEQPNWTGKNITLNYLSVLDAQAAWMQEVIQDQETDPLLRGLFNAGRWLRSAPEGLPWIPGVMRRLVSCLQNENLPLTLKAKALSALVLSGNSNMPVLLRQMAATPRPDLRQLAALGLGTTRDGKSVNEVVTLLDDPNPGVNRAAILALVTMGAKHGLEAVAGLLLSGDDSQRRAAAEGLANHPEEGHPTLEEGSAVEDVAVRRATIFGLGRTRQSWAIQILEKMRAEDSQWMIRDAANQVLEAITSANPRTPRPLPPLTHIPWLVTFAADRGTAVSPGKPAYELLFRALKEGTDDQKLAAIYYLKCKEDEGALLPLYQTYFSARGEVRERAWEALWSLSAAGVPLPPPFQFGLK